MKLRNLLFVVLLFSTPVFTAFAQSEQIPASAVSGKWNAVITNASGIDVPFVLSIIQDRSMPGKLRAAVQNGSDLTRFSGAEWNGHELKLALDQYDGVLTATVDGAALKGEWSRQTSKGVRHYPFRATREERKTEKTVPWKGPLMAGAWTFTFEGGGNDTIAPAEFKQSAAHGHEGAVVARVEGTVAPVSGDYGTLAGTIEQTAGKTTVKLSRFDGIHIVLLAGELQPDGSLRGKMNTQNFIAVRKQGMQTDGVDSATEPNPETITTMKDANEPFRFSARDPQTGKEVTQNDPRFKGKPFIVDIFGTWCPNCHDEAPVLTDIYRRYQQQGIEIVGLAYEYVDDAARNDRLLGVYRKKYEIEFPMLLAGTTDDGQIEKTLPQLQGFGAYPTTIFVGRDGKVRKIHAGFAGPATGERFAEVKKRFEENVKQLVAK